MRKKFLSHDSNIFIEKKNIFLCTNRLLDHQEVDSSVNLNKNVTKGFIKIGMCH